jgi:murein DD-endopeptidase MepM/ murein hydrolase activator NlpD
MTFRHLSLFLVIFIVSSAIGQSYPKGYFRYPLDIPPKLNANFGEMRPNHFHMGLDLYTNKRENLPVYAAADGYIARVKVEAGGFGHALYINHPNGYTTLYAHMNAFPPEVEAWIKAEQYKKESWSVELEAKPDQFPVRKGQVVGQSGNTGASQGPHVHFEIRDTKTEKCLNPLLFGFPIPDNLPPDLTRLALYDRNQSIYEQRPQLVALKKAGPGYVAGLVRVHTDKVTLAMQATDRMTNVPNPNGIFSISVEDNGRPVGGFRIDRVGYDETRYLNAHIDYANKLAGGAYLQNIFPLPGDRLDIYDRKGGANYISLKDTLSHDIRLLVRDAYGNTSTLSFGLQRAGPPIPPAPRSGTLMRPGELNVVETEDLQLYLPEGSLYDSIWFTRSIEVANGPLSYSPIHHLQSYLVPSHKYFSVRIKPDKAIPYPLREHMLIRRTGKPDDIDVAMANWQLGYYSAEFREFGSFQLVADNTPPVVSTNGLKDGGSLGKATKIVVSVTDDNKAIRSLRAELDGKWLCFARRGNTFTYALDEHCPPGSHTLKLRVEDEAGNTTEKTVSFTR